MQHLAGRGHRLNFGVKLIAVDIADMSTETATVLQFGRFDISSVGRSETVADTLSTPEVMLFLLKYQCTRIIHPLPSFPVGPHVVLYRVLGHTGLPLAANATHPPIKHNPPNGVTGPRNLNRCGSKTSKYIDPENIVIPAVKRPMASVFCGHATDAKVRMVECMSYEAVRPSN